MNPRPDPRKIAEEKKVRAICEKIVADASCQIYDLRIIPFSRVLLTIERIPGTPPIDEISRIHKRISHTMEDEGCDWMRYVIDVATPGVNRVFRSPGEFPHFLGKRIRVKRIGVIPAEELVTGDLTAADADGFLIRKEDGTELRLSFKDIDGAQLSPKLPF